MLYFLILFGLFFNVSFINGRRLNQPKEHIHHKIDYIILRQIWPEPTCMFPGEHSCSISKDVSTWVVHGLWPSENGEIGPNFCNSSFPFDFSKLKPLVSDLHKFWPNLYTDTPADSFWEHEWNKHGTCALVLDNISDEFDYFNVSLALRSNYDFGPMLAEKSIIPHDKMLYKLDDIKNAINERLNVEPILVCYILKESRIQYLSQMQICFDTEYNLIECSKEAVELINIMTNNDPQETECIESLPISYPVLKPSNWGKNKKSKNHDTL